jgi:hypothetical protein
LDKKKNKKKLKIDMIISAGNSLPNWIVVLIKNKFYVGIKYIPRALLVTFITLFLYPFVLLEKLLFDRKINKTKIKSPVFIIGHMRSGTTFLHYLLSKDDRFAYATTSQTAFPWVFLTLERVIRPFMKYVLPSKRPMDNMAIKEEYPQEEELAIANLCPYSPNNGAYFPTHQEEFYRKYSFFENINKKIINKWKKTYIYYLKKITFKNNGKRILSKSLVNSGRINLLLEMFPDAKFIFIYRNPYKLFLSTKKLYKTFIFKNMAFHDITDEKLEENILTCAKIGFKKYFNDRNLIKKGNLVEVKFEDFVKTPVEDLKKIYEILNIDKFEKYQAEFKNFAKAYENYKQDKYNISDELRERIYNKLKIVFDEFNYSKYEKN